MRLRGPSDLQLLFRSQNKSIFTKSKPGLRLSSLVDAIYSKDPGAQGEISFQS